MADMLITLALLGATTLAPSQAPKFENARFTYGPLGQTRKSDKFLPGDRVHVAATVKGLSVDKQGMVTYTMAFEIVKKVKGKEQAVQKGEPQEQKQLNWLGGDDVPVIAHWPIPRDDEAPGEYVMKLTCTDVANKKNSATLEQKFTVEKTKFAFILTHFLGVPVAVAGQQMGVQYALVGFDFDKKEKKTDVTITVQVLDDNGKAMLPKPLTSTIKSDHADAPGLMTFRPQAIELNRPGKYKVELTAKDNVSGETAREVLDLTVVEVK